MRIRGLGTAKRIAGWARSRLRGGPIILGYHRVAASRWDPQHLCVSPDNFRQQLEVLTSAAQPMSLSELTTSLGEGGKLDRRFVVTIDDGYEDTLRAALPILADNEVPGTAFVTTGIMGKPFWWCEVQKLVEESKRLPDRIDVAAGGHAFNWSRTSDSQSARAALVKSAGDLFRALPFDQQGEALAQLREAFDAGIPESGVRAMTPAEVAELCRSDLIEVGSHCVTHTSLNRLGVDEQREELQRSKEELESICGRPVVSCSYPNGRIAKATPHIARELGYTSACASHEELVPPGGDPMRLPRVWVGDLDGDRFSNWLSRWLR